MSEASGVQDLFQLVGGDCCASMEDLETLSGVLGLDQGLASVLKSLNWTTTRLATLVDAESLIIDWVIAGAREQESGRRLSREALVDLVHAAHT